MKLYDLAIVGSGPAGANAAKVAAEKGLSVLILERGKDLIKRRDLISGWFGKGIHDIDRFETTDILLNNPKAINDALKIVKKLAPKSNSGEFFKLPANFGTTLAAHFFEKLSKKVDILFNSEVLKVEQNGQEFIIHTVKNIFRSRYCLIATGKYSIEWIKLLCDELNLGRSENKIKVGVRVEIPTFRVKELIENGNIQVKDGYAGTDDTRFNSFVGEWEESNILSAFGYCMSGKESHRTNFMVGIETNSDITEIVREIKIVNILANDRIKCERIFDYMEGKSILKHIEMFNSLRSVFEKLESFLPSFTTYATMYIPEVRLSGILPVTENMETAISGLYGAGECTSRVSNLIGAMASGIIAAKTILKE